MDYLFVLMIAEIEFDTFWIGKIPIYPIQTGTDRAQEASNQEPAASCLLNEYRHDFIFVKCKPGQGKFIETGSLVSGGRRSEISSKKIINKHEHQKGNDGNRGQHQPDAKNIRELSGQGGKQSACLSSWNGGNELMSDPRGAV